MTNREVSTECFDNIQSIVNSLRHNGRLGDLMACLALERGNDAARDIFASHGGDIFFDGLGVTSTTVLADFLGVAVHYLRGLLSRLGFSQKKTPGDYQEFYLRDKLCNSQYTSSREGNRYLIVNKEREQRFYIASLGEQIFISPRVALCACFLMKYGQKIPKDAMALKMLTNAEHGSSYGLEAARIIAQRKADMKAKAEEKPAVPIESEYASVSEHGDVKMTTEFFATVFKDFSREFSAAFSSEFTKAFLSASAQSQNKKLSRAKESMPKKWSRKKKVLPDNWDAMVSKYVSGEMTLKEIAVNTGWCVDTVRKKITNTIS